MNISSVLLTTLTAVLVLWIALSMWRTACINLMHEIERSYREYYAAYSGDGREMQPPMKWDYEQEKLIPIPPEDIRVIERSGGLQAEGAVASEKRLPASAYGIILARIPAAWFHGAFAAASLVLTVLLVKVRAG